MMPYCLGLGFAMGLGHEKQERRKERSSDWYDRIVFRTFTDEQWVENFRMPRQTFNKVCRVLEPDLSPMENTVRDAIDVQKQVAHSRSTGSPLQLSTEQLGIYLVWQNPSLSSAFTVSVKL